MKILNYHLMKMNQLCLLKKLKN